jgi:hypothetical protein
MDLFKKSVSCVIFCMLIISAGAQKRIVVEGTKGGAYFTYSVRPGETLSSIGQQFKTDLTTVMQLNKMNAASKLGKTVRVPFNPAILSQDKNATTLPTAVVHKVAKGENLYRISLGHNKVDMETLKKWNALPADAIVEEGQEVIVGFVNLKAGTIPVDATKTKTADPLVNTTNKPVDVAIKTPAVADPNKSKTKEIVPAPVKQNEAQKTNTTADTKTKTEKLPPVNTDQKQAETKTANAEHAVANANDEIAKNETAKNKTVKQPDTKKNAALTKEKPEVIEEDKSTIQSKAADNFASNAMIKELETKKDVPVTQQPVNISNNTEKAAEPKASNTLYPDNRNINDTIRLGESGFFAKAFGKGVEGRSLQTLTGTSMTFRSISGWNDKKFYILMNDVPPGSIVKVSNGGSRYLYAKVLWNLGGIKENDGLDFRISNAAAAALGIADTKFPLIVTYYE